ncbi:MAG: nitroreductase family protein [Lachnospiraceae bacterium]|nr:nitroreductase family protein [Lachnospiraceae bacterium]
MTLYEAIFRRKSIRKYRQDEIDSGILEEMEHFGEDALGIRPDIPVKWKIYRAQERLVKGRFLVKAPYYIAIYSEAREDYRRNAGCLMEQLSLWMLTKGIGSCYQGSARIRGAGEPGMEPVMVMAFGYPAEPLERRREDFRRIEMKKMVTVHGKLGPVQKKLLEAARLAPSAMNQQPWRFVSADDRIHLFVKKPGGFGRHVQENYNLFDAGIAFSHMLITAEEQWFDLSYQKLDHILEKDFQNYIYVGSLLIQDA